MLTVWGRANAFNVQKVMWAVGELGVAHERIDVGGAFGGLDDPAFLSRNPNGTIPVLNDGAVTVWESHAIVRYLAARYGAGGLWPEEPGARSGADLWMDWMQTTLQPDFMRLFWGYVRRPPEARDWPRLRAVLRRYGKLLGLLDRHLAAQPYLAGESFTMADIPVGTSLYRTVEMGLEGLVLPDHVAAWHERLSARGAYQDHVMIPFDEMWGREGY
ncbi:MAG: glutathione S-transferase family protein [Pseudomonadota bacterium]